MQLACKQGFLLLEVYTHLTVWTEKDLRHSDRNSACDCALMFSAVEVEKKVNLLKVQSAVKHELLHAVKC